MKAEMDKLDAQSRQSYYNEMERLRERQNKAQEKLESLKHTGEEFLNDIKVGVENAVPDLEETIGSVLTRFK